MRIFRHIFVGGKAKIRRRAVALQGFLTQSPAKFDEKKCMNPYVDRFLLCAEYTVTGIAYAGNYVLILIKTLIHNAGININVRVSRLDSFNALR